MFLFKICISSANNRALIFLLAMALTHMIPIFCMNNMNHEDRVKEQKKMIKESIEKFVLKLEKNDQMLKSLDTKIKNNDTRIKNLSNRKEFLEKICDLFKDDLFIVAELKDEILMTFFLKYLSLKLHPDNKSEETKANFRSIFNILNGYRGLISNHNQNSEAEDSNSKAEDSDRAYREKTETMPFFNKNTVSTTKVYFTFYNGLKSEYEVTSIKELENFERKSSLVYKVARSNKELRLNCSDRVFGDIIRYIKVQEKQEEENLLFTFLDSDDISYLIGLFNMYTYLDFNKDNTITVSLWGDIATKIVTSSTFTPDYIQSEYCKNNNADEKALLLSLYSNIIKYLEIENNPTISDELLKKYPTFKELINDNQLFTGSDINTSIFTKLKNSTQFKSIIEKIVSIIPLCFVFKIKTEEWKSEYNQSVEKIVDKFICISGHDMSLLGKSSDFIKNLKKVNTKLIDLSDLNFDIFRHIYNIIYYYTQSFINKNQSIIQNDNKAKSYDNYVNIYNDYINKKVIWYGNDLSITIIRSIDTIITYALFKITNKELNNIFIESIEKLYTRTIELLNQYCEKYKNSDYYKKIQYYFNNECFGIKSHIDFFKEFDEEVFLRSKDLKSQKQYIESIIKKLVTTITKKIKSSVENKDKVGHTIQQINEAVDKYKVVSKASASSALSALKGKKKDLITGSPKVDAASGTLNAIKNWVIAGAAGVATMFGLYKYFSSKSEPKVELE